MGCTEAMTDSRANRGKSSGATTCACSIRGRAAPAGARGSGRLRRLESVQGDTVAPVPDGVDPELPSAAARVEGDRGQSLGRRHEQARFSLLVGVVGQERRAPAPQRAVRVGLDGAHRQEIRAAADADAARERRRKRVRLGRHGGIDTDRQLPRRGQALERRDRRRIVAGGVLDLRQTRAGAGLRPGEKPPVEVGRRRQGHRLADEVHGVVDENPRGRPVAPAQDAASVGVLRRGVDARRSERGRVDPEGVAVHAPRDGRAVRKHAIERPGVGELAARPEVLVPAPPLGPRSGRQPRSRLAHAAGGGLGVRKPAQVGDRARLPDAEQVEVRVGPARKDELPRQVDDPGAARHRSRAGRIADEEDPSAAGDDRDPRRRGARRRVDDAVLEKKVGNGRARDEEKETGQKRDHPGILTEGRRDGQVLRTINSVWSSYCGTSAANASMASNTVSVSSSGPVPAATSAVSRSRPNSSSAASSASETPSV